MILYFVRHGETDWNKKGLFQGSTDIELNDVGRGQARDAHDRLLRKGISFEKVYSSPLVRAIETAKIISGKDEKEIVIDDRIKEMTFGDLEGTDYYEIKKTHGLLFKEPSSYVPTCGEESYEHILDRTKSFLDDIIAEYKDKDGNILIQTHGAAIRALLLNLRNLELDKYWTIEVGNCQFFKFEIKGDIIREMDASDINTNI